MSLETAVCNNHAVDKNLWTHQWVNKSKGNQPQTVKDVRIILFAEAEWA